MFIRYKPVFCFLFVDLKNVGAKIISNPGHSTKFSLVKSFILKTKIEKSKIRFI